MEYMEAQMDNLITAGMSEYERLSIENHELRKDAERYRWLSKRMLSADFDYMDTGKQVIVFEMPDGFQVSANCDATIDAAMASKNGAFKNK